MSFVSYKALWFSRKNNDLKNSMLLMLSKPIYATEYNPLSTLTSIRISNSIGLSKGLETYP
jgi:hypothetical protein